VHVRVVVELDGRPEVEVPFSNHRIEVSKVTAKLGLAGRRQGEKKNGVDGAVHAVTIGTPSPDGTGVGPTGRPADPIPVEKWRH